MFPPNWPSPSNSSAASPWLPQCRSGSCVRGRAPFYQHSEVLCSPDPSWCCHVWFNAQQRDYPAISSERARAGLRVPRHGAVHLRRRGLRFDGKSRQWRRLLTLIRSLVLAKRDDDIAPPILKCNGSGLGPLKPLAKRPSCLASITSSESISPASRSVRLSCRVPLLPPFRRMEWLLNCAGHAERTPSIRRKSSLALSVSFCNAVLDIKGAD